MLSLRMVVNTLAWLANAQSFNITSNIDPTAARDWFSNVLQNITVQNLSQIPAGIEKNVSDQFVQIFNGQSVASFDGLTDLPASLLLADVEEPLTQNVTVNALQLNSDAGAPKVTTPAQNRNWCESFTAPDGFMMAKQGQAFDTNPATCKYAVIYRLNETKSMLRALGSDDWQLTVPWPDNHHEYKIIESPIPIDSIFDTANRSDFTAQVARLISQNQSDDLGYLFDTVDVSNTPNTTLGHQLVANTSLFYAPGTNASSSNTGKTLFYEPPVVSPVTGSTPIASSYITAIQNAIYQENMNTTISYESVKGTVECYNDSLSLVAREAFRQAASVSTIYINGSLQYDGIFGSDIYSGNGSYFNCTAYLERHIEATRAHLEVLSNSGATGIDTANSSLVLNITSAKVYRSNDQEELYSALTNGSDGNQLWVLPFGGGAISGRDVNFRSFVGGMAFSDRVNATMLEHVEDFSLTFGFPNSTLQQEAASAPQDSASASQDSASASQDSASASQDSTSAPQDSPERDDASLMTARTATRVYTVVAVVNNCSSTG